jgi:hypothetical protein
MKSNNMTTLKLLGGVAFAFAAPGSAFAPTVASSNSRVTAEVQSTALFSTSEDETQTTPAVEVNGDTGTLAPQEEETVYYKILSEDAPLGRSTRAPSAGDVLYVAPINGWVPKEDYALWGLPGAIPPLGFFDPIGFARQGTPLNDAKRLREAEIQHGRVAMLATLGYFFQEHIPNGGPFGITGPASDQLQQIPAPAFVALTTFIAALELYRAKVGWVEPQARIGSNTLWTLRDTYYPGDIGFDPLGLKPTENYDFQRMQTKEISNGRLAMIGWAGMCSQELINHRTIEQTWNFYQTWLSGDNPYEGYY